MARLDKVLEMVDTLSVQMRHTPFAILVIIEEANSIIILRFQQTMEHSSFWGHVVLWADVLLF